MTYARILWVPDVLRRAGLTVVEHQGWKARGLSETRSFDPRYVVWHHDASAKGDSPGVPDFMIRNYETAAAQLWVNRQGEWHIIASGRAPHAGAVLDGMPSNYTSIGVETDHTTGEDWPPALLDSLRKGTAAILRHLGAGAEGLHFHKTICDPPGRKTDPDALDLATERRNVAALISPPAPAPIPHVEDDLPSTDDLIKALTDALRDVDNPLARQIRNNVRIAVQAELTDERNKANPGQ